MLVLALLWLAPIVGGVDDSTDVAVVDLELGGAQCSGVVVAPRVVLTAAHCIAPGGGMVVDFGAVVDRVWVDRYYTGDVDHDLAALHVDRDLPVTPLQIAAPAAGQVTLVGFGATVPLGPRGVRHAVVADIVELAPRHLVAGTAGATSCTGDSGGAALDATGAVVGIVSAGDDACAGPSHLARPDAEPQLAEVLAAWSGPCPADGACQPGCADPDCDPCAFQGTCDPTCATVDLDCPLAGAAGASCTAATDCESRACVPVAEGAAFGAICSAPCQVAADCPAPLDACPAGSCVYTHTPGIAGAACLADADCRSHLCDPDARACTQPCGAADTCPPDLVCAPVRDTRACTTSTGCAAAGSTPAIVPVVIAFAIRRRRR